ncbi:MULTISPECIES: 6,7-dimethyl-8-ribityllumazine synthase [Bosea]|jgi:6,7-dimethyl-8-ribityllumazine synthase|uniref:6,7-dimethyl-8-ribityllumazine synthase n=1 Tax=Bosea TaxID=85413 RepID=UPI00140EEAAD|nr:MULTISPECIES: 6,7-dimethyl-8-ribityllumazine synthase [Bosea]MCR4520438.1 6,7-dimethyl-8-ribityllumazine synthase [Bosea sp. 47.2.35]MDR6827790.1 6,7-dimethyl-8-ribityllumazine synthase [Bosea robiniae]MDR6894516.1 6,7-dimethyl-8-ribityllumazine synthase [Bosea sp. BE109]MDR7137896.1 6,7-dimethyl-8-ribityllumazine synthase [Bosea sp. BE168]MDR7174595.1 6,7-dimethyl-8-ribityllumazine synthase [Bosea sp. BE271]
MAGPRQTSADKAATPAVEIDGARVLVVEARFYDNYADELLAGALAVLEEAGCRVDVVTVPGALEIPSAIVIGLRAADEAVDPYEAVVALGTVIRGETGHYDIVAGESSRALMDLSVAFALPLGNGILTVENEAQAWARANREDMNKGGGAAEAALAVLRYKRSLAEPSQ